jgi:Acyl CoA:acetate/3-ketoacid CoA transferase
MGKSKVISQEQAAALVKDGDLVATQSIGMAGIQCILLKVSKKDSKNKVIQKILHLCGPAA